MSPPFTPPPSPPATPTPAPTPTPTPVPDPRFAVIAAGSKAQLAYRLAELGVDTYIDYTADPATVPAGYTKVPFVSGRPGDRLPADTVTAYAQGAPGAVWYIGGELNVRYISGADYVAEFNYYAGLIKAADPTAKLMSASILNWDFTCTGCGDPNYPKGEVWLRDFVETYQSTYAGVLPPVDIWAIDAYPLTWDSLPMIRSDIVIDQIAGLRDYLDELLLFTAPIWVTEIASHWAYDAVVPVSGGHASLPNVGEPGGYDWDDDYQWAVMETYVSTIVDWLRTTGADKHVEKWFFNRDYVNVRNAEIGDPYAGLYFFEGLEVGAPLNRTGRLYRDYAKSLK